MPIWIGYNYFQMKQLLGYVHVTKTEFVSYFTEALEMSAVKTLGLITVVLVVGLSATSGKANGPTQSKIHGPIHNCSALLVRNAIGILEQLNPFIFFSNGYPLHSKPIVNPQIDSIDQTLWAHSMRNDAKEFGSIEFYDHRGLLRAQKLISGSTSGIPLKLIVNAFNDSINALSNSGMRLATEISKIIFRHTHPQTIGLRGLVIKLPYQFSRGDRLVSYYLRNFLSREPDFAHIIFEMDLVYADSDRTQLKKKSYLLMSQQHFFLPE